jgi:hypothetical protein
MWAWPCSSRRARKSFDGLSDKQRNLQCQRPRESLQKEALHTPPLFVKRGGNQNTHAREKRENKFTHVKALTVEHVPSRK